MKNKRIFGLLAAVMLATVFTATEASIGQTLGDAPKTVTLVKREIREDEDNYTRATFSFKYGVNGDESLPLTRNNWDVEFGNNGNLPDSFDVSMVVDDRSRIKDLGALAWSDEFTVPVLTAYPEPTRDPSVKAVVGHMYVVHTKDRNNDHYSVFRVEDLVPNQSVTISWRLIPAPEQN